MATNIDLTKYDISGLSANVQRQTSRFYAEKSEVKLAVNASSERLGGIQKAKGVSQLGDSVGAGTTLGLAAFNKSDGTDKIMSFFGTDVYVYNSGTSAWDAQSQTFTASQTFDTSQFLDYLFVVNGTDANRTYDGSSWSQATNLGDAPKASFIQGYQTRLYLGVTTVGATTYKSRVWYSNLPKNDTVTWGLETGADLSQSSSSAVVTSAGSTFKTNGIITGNTFRITTGTNAGEYTVQSVDSETQITLTETLVNTASNSTFWVGGNYFDVRTNDGDTIQGLGENAAELLVYKRNSLHRYNIRANTLYRVENALGTTSFRSILSLGGHTFSYHPLKGISRYRAGVTEVIGEPINDVLKGMATAKYTAVTSWSENDRYACFYIGDTTLRDGETVSECVVVFDTFTEHWTLRSYPQAILGSTFWYNAGVPQTYICDDSGEVYQTDSGYGYGTTALTFNVETNSTFPAGTDATIDFRSLRIYVEDIVDLAAQYRLIYRPMRDDGIWTNDITWKPLSGSIRGNKSEFQFPTGSRASGVELRLIESSTNKVSLIEKMTLYYAEPRHDK